MSVGRSGVAIPVVATGMESGAEAQGEIGRRRGDEEENRGGAGAATGCGSVAVENRPGHDGRPRLGGGVRTPDPRPETLDSNFP